MVNEKMSEVVRQDLSNYIKEKSSILVKKEDFTEELTELAEPMKGILGYFDTKNVRFSVEGYDFVYIDFEGNLSHVKIKPEEILDLDMAGKLGEADNLEDQIMGAGFVIASSESFRAAIYRQLNK